MVQKYIIAFLIFCLHNPLQAKECDVDKLLDVNDLEELFLEHNYQLLVARYHIDQADAQILQSKLFPNPRLGIGEANLWSNPSSERLPYLFGSYGSKQQISLEIEQLIETAGKRRKRVALKQLEKNTALLDFEETLLNLRYDLRNTFISLQKLIAQEVEVRQMVDYLTQLNEQYARQSKLQTIPKTDYYRVQSALITWKEQLTSLVDEQMEKLSRLRQYTQQPLLSLTDLALSPKTSYNLSLKVPANLHEIALHNRLAIKRSINNLSIAHTELSVEKAERVPDITLQFNYDRGGNIMRDFIGIGFSIDLPIFHKNQGHIKAAHIGIAREQEIKTGAEFELNNDLYLLVQQLTLYEKALLDYNNGSPDEFKNMMETYAQHLASKQVTLMEFIDFSESYISARQAYLELQEKYYHTFEELQYNTGKDL